MRRCAPPFFKLKTMPEQTEIIELIRAQAGMSRDIMRAQQDVNEVARIQRDDAKAIDAKIDEIDSKVDKLDSETDKRIWKAIGYVIGLFFAFVAWIISNKDNLDGMMK